MDEIKASDLQLRYQRSGGGFGVTNGKLADPAVARVYVAPKPAEPDEPDEPDSSGEPAGDPDVPSGEEMPEEPDPEGPGDVSQPGEPSEPENPATIDPADIFPDPTPGSQSGGEELPQQQDETQAVA